MDEYRKLRIGIKVKTSDDSKKISVLAVGHFSKVGNIAFVVYPCHQYPSFGISEYVYYVVCPGQSGSNLLFPSDTASRVSYYGIVICRNFTKVDIHATGYMWVVLDFDADTFQLTLPGQVISVVVNAGSTLYCYYQGSDILKDNTGDKVVTNTSVAIFSGNRYSVIPRNDTSLAGNCMYAQLTPTFTWGKTFLLGPFADKVDGQRYKVIALRDGAIATKTCTTSSGSRITETITFDSDRIAVFDTDEYCSVVSDSPLFVAQFQTFRNTSTNRGAGNQLMIVPLEQYDHEMYHRPITYPYSLVYMNMFMPHDDYFNNYYLFNGVMTSILWVKIYGPNSLIGYGATISISAMPQLVVTHPHTNGTMYTTMYGYTTNDATNPESYIVNGGMKFDCINTEIGFNATTYSVTEGQLLHVGIDTGLCKNLAISLRLYGTSLSSNSALHCECLHYKVLPVVG